VPVWRNSETNDERKNSNRFGENSQADSRDEKTVSSFIFNGLQGPVRRTYLFTRCENHRDRGGPYYL